MAEPLDEKRIDDEGAAGEPHPEVPLPDVIAGHRSRSPRRRSRSRRRPSAKPMARPSDSIKTVERPTTTAEKKLTFQCQLAHGSPTGLISGFNRLNQLYQAVADCYDGVVAEDILFCTVNTHKLDMDRLLSSNIGLNDFIFAHVRGQRKQVELEKRHSSLGLTITDNGCGKAFIKRIKPGSIAADAQPAIDVGDHIEKINGESVTGLRHFAVAKILRSVRVGEKFTLRLIEPQKSGFSFIGPRSSTAPKKQTGFMLTTGLETLRFKATGSAVLQEAPSPLIVIRMNEVFDTYLGFHDDDLALTVWELGRDCDTLEELSKRISQSDVAAFEFPAELVYDMWGVIDDWRSGRLRLRPLPVSDLALELDAIANQ